MKNFKFYITIALLFYFYGANAQEYTEKLTEQQAINLALSKSVTLNDAKLNIDKQQADVGGAFELNPLSLDYRKVRVNSTTAVQEISAIQNFGSILSHINRYKLAKSKVELAKVDAKIAEKEAIRNVRSLYQQWHYLYALKRLLEQQQANVTEIKNFTERLHQSGEIGGLENDITVLQSLSIQAQKSTIDKEFSEVENNLKALLQLTQTIQPQTEFPEPLVSDFSKTMSKEFSEAMEKRDNVATKNISLAKSVYFPEITAGLINRKAGDARDFMGFTIGIQIPLPLGNNRAAIKKQRIIKEEIAFENEAERIKIQNHKESLSQQLNTLKAEVDTISKTFEKAKKFIDKLSIAYESGEIGAYKFNQSFEAYFEVMQNYLALIHTYNQTVIEYEYYIDK